MSVKIERLNDQFQKEISIILQTEIKDQDIHFVTITGCDITNDLSFCKVYFTVLDESKKESTLHALKGAASFIRGELSKRIQVRHTPELRFFYDDSIEYGNKIEQGLVKEDSEKLLDTVLINTNSQMAMMIYNLSRYGEFSISVLS